MAHRIEDIDIQPEQYALQSFNLTPEDFYQALERALDHLEGRPAQELPAPSNIPIVVRGQERRLGELARIAVSLSPSHAD